MMRIFHKISETILNEYYFYSLRKFKYEIVNDVPKIISERKIFVITEGTHLDSLVFICPCGCNSSIFLNLLDDAKPCWKYRITKRGNISIIPSIKRKVGCKSHFYIREGRIKWIY